MGDIRTRALRGRGRDADVPAGDREIGTDLRRPWVDALAGAIRPESIRRLPGAAAERSRCEFPGRGRQIVAADAQMVRGCRALTGRALDIHRERQEDQKPRDQLSCDHAP